MAVMSGRTKTMPTAIERALWTVMIDEAKAQKMSQAEFSRRSGISTSQMSRYSLGQATALHPHVESAAAALNRKLSSIYLAAEKLVAEQRLKDLGFDFIAPAPGDFDLAAREPGYPKGNPAAEVDEDNLP